MTKSASPAAASIAALTTTLAIAAAGAPAIAIATASAAADADDEPAPTWRAGVAREAITPDRPTWMAGYASRTEPSQGARHELWAKAVALEAPGGGRAVLVALDLCGISREEALPLREGLAESLGIPLPAVVLACSHTHSGPVVGSNLITMYRIDEKQREAVLDYMNVLRGKIRRAAEAAVADLRPAALDFADGTCDVAVNRRENAEARVPELRAAGELKGPVDHHVPVLRIAEPGPEGRTRALVFGYACHCTVLSDNLMSGDYAGYAQIALERESPGTTALFVAGCGGDQNPLPRRTEALAVEYGERLARSVLAAVGPEGRTRAIPAEPATRLVARGVEIPLRFAEIPPREEWERRAASDNFFEAARARKILDAWDRDGGIPQTYPYPIVAWSVGGTPWLFLGGEVVVDYALRLKRETRRDNLWIAAYANDVMAYIPSLRVLREGGYEGGGSMLYYGRPAHWAESVEEDIVAAAKRLLDELGGDAPETKPGD